MPEMKFSVSREKINKVIFRARKMRIPNKIDAKCSEGHEDSQNTAKSTLCADYSKLFILFILKHFQIIFHDPLSKLVLA